LSFKTATFFLICYLAFIICKKLFYYLHEVIDNKFNRNNKNKDKKLNYNKKNNLPFSDDKLDLKLSKEEPTIYQSNALSNLQNKFDQYIPEDGLEENQEKNEEFSPQKKVTGFDIKGPWTKYVLRS